MREQGIPENTVKYGHVGEQEVKMSGGGNQDLGAGLREPHMPQWRPGAREECRADSEEDQCSGLRRTGVRVVTACFKCLCVKREG